LITKWKHPGGKLRDEQRSGVRLCLFAYLIVSPFLIPRIRPNIVFSEYEGTQITVRWAQCERLILLIEKKPGVVYSELTNVDMMPDAGCMIQNNTTRSHSFGNRMNK
jgi:hypothetical protein